MISNLGAQIIYSRGKDESISYDLKPHNVDITELVQQYKFVTNTNIVRDPYDHLIGYRSASHDIDQVFLFMIRIIQKLGQDIMCYVIILNDCLERKAYLLS